MSSPDPNDDNARMLELESHEILDTMPKRENHDIALLTTEICQTKMSTLAMLDREQKWHKSKVGISKEWMPRDFSICLHMIRGEEPFIVPDTQKDDVFCKIGMVRNPPHVRFYAGVPLINENGFALGTLCAIDTDPKTLDDYQVWALQSLARQVVLLLELRRKSLRLEKTLGEKEAAKAKNKALASMLPICCCCKKIRDDQDYWYQVEDYISQHRDTTFTHGYCPDCHKAAIA